MSTEEMGTGIVAPAIDAIRRAEGLEPDPGGDLLRASAWLTTFPKTLDEGDQPVTHRFHDPAWEEEGEELPDWWPGRDDQPLVYVTFGSVAGQFPQALPAYGVALSAVADLPARVLLTVGRDLDLAALPDVPDNVRIEPWVPQQDVLGHAAAAVVHGGSGSTLGALAAGLPLVVIPLDADQAVNARRCAALGVAEVLEPDRRAPEAIRATALQVLQAPRYRLAARRLREEMEALPGPDYAVQIVERLVAEQAP
jgi:MGT family glycosyltransferase